MAKNDNPWFSTPDEMRGRKRVTVTLDPKTIEGMRTLAEADGSTFSAFVEEAILEHLARKKDAGARATLRDAKDAEIRRLRGELARLRAQLGEVVDDAADD